MSIDSRYYVEVFSVHLSTAVWDWNCETTLYAVTAAVKLWALFDTRYQHISREVPVVLLSRLLLLLLLLYRFSIIEN